MQGTKIFLTRAKTWGAKLLVWRNFGEREAQVADHGPNRRNLRPLERVEFLCINPFDGWLDLKCLALQYSHALWSHIGISLEGALTDNLPVETLV